MHCRRYAYRHIPRHKDLRLSASVGIDSADGEISSKGCRQFSLKGLQVLRYRLLFGASARISRRGADPDALLKQTVAVVIVAQGIVKVLEPRRRIFGFQYLLR